MGFLVSPGVQVNEIDLTNIVPAVQTSIGAIAAPFEKGPVLEVNNINSENLTNPNPDTEKWLNSQDMSKKVSFSENNNEIIESKIEVDDNKFLNLLNEIKKNQIEILDLLKNR